MRPQPTNQDDLVDVRDLIARLEELQTQKELRESDHAEDSGMPSELDEEDQTELDQIEGLLDDLRGYGGDHQWKGSWYPVTLIRDSHFVDYCKELVVDIGDLPNDIPDYLCINWEGTANNLQVDYASVEWDGVTYWYR
jgi:hypothetical protein